MLSPKSLEKIDGLARARDIDATWPRAQARKAKVDRKQTARNLPSLTIIRADHGYALFRNTKDDGNSIHPTAKRSADTLSVFVHEFVSPRREYVMQTHVVSPGYPVSLSSGPHMGKKYLLYLQRGEDRCKVNERREQGSRAGLSAPGLSRRRRLRL